MPRNLNEQHGMENQDDKLRNNSGGKQQEQGQQDDMNVSNPQQGSSWNNYQSRELSDNQEGRLGAEEASKAFEEDE